VQHVSDLLTEPVLRIETGQHGARIWRIDTDAENRFAVTASETRLQRLSRRRRSPMTANTSRQVAEGTPIWARPSVA
jgi:hypothetical protein